MIYIHTTLTPIGIKNIFRGTREPYYYIIIHNHKTNSVTKWLHRPIGISERRCKLNHNKMDKDEALKSAYNQGVSDAERRLGFQHSQMISDAIKTIQLELRAQGASNTIRTFGGEGSQRFNEWVNDINRLRVQLGADGLPADDARSRILVLQSLSGPAADYATRVVQESPAISWDSLHKKLRERYNDLAESQYSRLTLRRIVQRKDEGVQNYFERVFTAARNAYSEEDIKDRLIQTSLTEIFVDGLQDDDIARRLIRHKPKDMETALKLAVGEYQIKKTYKLRRGIVKEGPEPMEVDQLSIGQVQNPTDVKLLKRVEDLIEAVSCL